jgi:hypothetical protein
MAAGKSSFGRQITKLYVPDPANILYARYSSLSCGASDFLGSNLIAICWLFKRLVPIDERGIRDKVPWLGIV